MSHNRPPPFKMDPKYLTPAAQPHVKERISLDEPETVVNKPPEHNRLGLFSAYNQAAGSEPPYTMTAPIDASSETTSAACRISSCTVAFSAFMGGRCSVIVATSAAL